MMTEQPKIRIRSLYKLFGKEPKKIMPHVLEGMSKSELLDTYNHVLGLKNINLDIPDRKIQVIMGLSGSGKSTLIRHLNRLIDPTDGVIELDGENVLSMNRAELRNLRRSKMSMVFQKFGLLPHRNVLKNVQYGLDIKGMPQAKARAQAEKWIARVGLSGYEAHFPGKLSGGMQQRVGLARALATDCEILLMDEAFSALDPLIRKDMQSILLKLQDELNKTIVFITHDLDEALYLGDRIAILRDGEIIQSGDPQQILMNPEDDYIREFIRDVNRAKVVRIRSIMDDDKTAEGEPLFLDETVEAALPKLHAKTGGRCPVFNRQGECVGSVSVDSAINALKQPRHPLDGTGVGHVAEGKTLENLYQ